VLLAVGCNFTPGSSPQVPDAPSADTRGLDANAAVLDAGGADAAVKTWVVIDTLSIVTYAPQLTPQSTMSAVTLAVGTTYKLRASGMFPCTTTSVPGDAEYWDFTAQNNFTSGIDFGISVDDTTPDGTKLDWGPYSSTHVYETPYEGTGKRIVAVLFDSQYNNNTGSLKLEVLELK